MKWPGAGLSLVAAGCIAAALHFGKYAKADTPFDVLNKDLQQMPRHSAVAVKLYGDVFDKNVVKEQIRYMLAPLPVYFSPDKVYDTILYLSSGQLPFQDTNSCTVMWQRSSALYNYHLVNCVH